MTGDLLITCLPPLSPCEASSAGLSESRQAFWQQEQGAAMTRASQSQMVSFLLLTKPAADKPGSLRAELCPPALLYRQSQLLTGFPGGRAEFEAQSVTGLWARALSF